MLLDLSPEANTAKPEGKNGTGVKSTGEDLAASFLFRAVDEFFELLVPLIESSFNRNFGSNLRKIMDSREFPKHAMLINQLFKAFVESLDVTFDFHTKETSSRALNMPKRDSKD